MKYYVIVLLLEKRNMHAWRKGACLHGSIVVLDSNVTYEFVVSRPINLYPGPCIPAHYLARKVSLNT